jgi:hypothetical protein
MTMSIYTSVYFRGPVPRTADVERALTDIGMPFTINDGLEIEGHSGYLPMTYEEFEDEIGTEVLFSTGPPVVEKFTAIYIIPVYTR